MGISSAEKKTYKVDYDKVLNPLPSPIPDNAPFLKPYTDFFQEVFDTMDREYYAPISRETYDTFVSGFKQKVLSRLKDKETVVTEIKYLGAGLLVQKLKDPTDSFSGFMPPKEAEEFQSQVLGYELGIGLSGHMTYKGYELDKVELRSDSYKKGIQKGDVVLKIDDVNVLKMSEEELKKALYPPLGTIVNLEVYFSKKKTTEKVGVEVIEFFKETLGSIPTGVPGMFYIKINQFNEKTGDDFIILTNFYIRQGMNKLVIDLRENPGGPPLAARDIASLFFKPGTELFYFQRKNRPKALLGTIFKPIHYDGQIAVLIDKGSGSASELFSGMMKQYNRAVIFGNENSAGKTFLKSMFKMNDESMLFLVTSLAYMSDGEQYPLSGVKPDIHVPDNVDMFKYISKCLDAYGKK